MREKIIREKITLKVIRAKKKVGGKRKKQMKEKITQKMRDGSDKREIRVKRREKIIENDERESNGVYG